MAFSENLIRERRARSLSQEKLAELVGVSRQTVSQWENGYTEPDLTRLRRLAELFDLSLDELVEGPRPAKEEAAPEEPAGPWRWESLPHSGVRTLAFEYRSRRTLFGLPLVHIHLGCGRSVATGILAIGNVARGAVAIGGVSAGLIAVGGVSAGLLFSLGGLAVGFLALGGLAVGYLALGDSRWESMRWAAQPLPQTSPPAARPWVPSPSGTRPSARFPSTSIAPTRRAPCARPSCSASPERCRCSRTSSRRCSKAGGRDCKSAPGGVS